jgi:transposase
MRWHGRRVQVYAYTRPTDMRKGFDGLCALVTQGLQRDPLSGDIFIFVSRDRIRAKTLQWDGTGLCLYAMRLERGRLRHCGVRGRRSEGPDDQRARTLPRWQHTGRSRRALAAGDHAVFACVRSRGVIKCVTDGGADEGT